MVTETQIEGVRTLWVDSDGPDYAALMFRVGRADETLPMSGITHLLEHLALQPMVASRSSDVNGSVDQTTTAFWTSGPNRQEFLRRLCEQLREPPADRLAAERGILLSEAAQHASDPLLKSLMQWRYGARTYGVATWPEFGLHRITIEDLARWSSQWLTRENAVLLWTGKPPADLRLPLPSGSRRQPPAAESAVDTLPGWFPSSLSSTAALCVVDRSMAGGALAEVLRELLFRELRYERAVSYQPTAVYEPLDATSAHLILAADSVEGRQGEVAEVLLTVLGRLAAGEVDDPALEGWRQAVTRVQLEPGLGRAWLSSCGKDLLLGGPLLSVLEVVEMSQRVTAEEVAQSAGRAQASALYAVPVETAVTAQLTRAPMCSQAPVSGQRLFEANARTLDRAITVADDGLTLTTGPDTHVTVRFDRTAAALSWLDGDRLLIAADGCTIHVQPQRWRSGSLACQAVDRFVDPALFVVMPNPEPGPQQAPAPATGRRWDSWAFAAQLVLVFGASVLLALVFRFPLAGVGAFLAGVGMLTSRWQQVHERRATDSAQRTRTPPPPTAPPEPASTDDAGPAAGLAGQGQPEHDPGHAEP